MKPETTASMKNGTPAIRTDPCAPRRKLATVSAAFKEAARTARPCTASWRPIAVGCKGFRPATNSGSPMRFSSSDRVRERAGCEAPSRAAPSVTPPASTTAESWARWRSSIFIAFRYNVLALFYQRAPVIALVCREAAPSGGGRNGDEPHQRMAPPHHEHRRRSGGLRFLHQGLGSALDQAHRAVRRR